jgi:peptide/nickel transport system substrate-binding protein
MIVQPEPPTLAAYLNTSTGTRELSMKIYESLMNLDFGLKPVPNLAKAWTLSPDAKSVTFRLQEGVRWHDGKPFTSADVQFSIMEVLRKSHPLGRVFLQAVNAVEAPDPMTAVLKLDHPAPYLFAGLADTNSPIIPSHLFAGTDVTTSAYANKPIGTGPFKFTTWERGQYIRLDRNPDYWKPPLPYLDGIVARFIPDSESRANALETGDVLFAGYAGGVPLEDAKRLAALPNLVMTTKGLEFLNAFVVMDINTRRTPWDDARVRRAVAYAIDRKFVLDNVWAGFGKPATGPISSNLTAKGIYTSDVRHYNVPNGPEIANKLLDEAGHPRAANGTRFEMVLDITPYGPEWQRFGDYVRQAFAKIGIKAMLRYEDVPTWLRRIYTDYDFEITINNSGTFDDPVIGVDRYYKSSNIIKGVPFSNDSQWSSPRTDALMASAAIEPDPAKRAAMYHEFQQLVVDASPYVWVIEQTVPNIYNKRVHNAIVSGVGYLDSFRDIWLSK